MTVLLYKINFGAHLGHPFGPFFPFFPSFFFCSFCLFSCFFHFCSFLHFLIFECFSFSLFNFFRRKKVSSFLFSCISFKYVSLLANVSEFNCFLRCRCSMEMWCPDDVGRDSWDWVGPPGWERACFNSPEWGGGSSPVKTEPLQIVLLLLLLLLLWSLWSLLCVVVCCFWARPLDRRLETTEDSEKLSLREKKKVDAWICQRAKTVES